MMRLPKSFLTWIVLLTPLAWANSTLLAQSPAPAKTPQAKQPAKTDSAAKPVAQAKPPAKGGPAAQKPAQPKKKAPRPEKPSEPARVARRDPFDPLVGKHRPSGDSGEHLPPGKAGLVVSTLRLDGIVRGPNGMIAVVSNPQQRVYFLREGDQLYDGKVEHITLEAVSFHEVGKDAFGKPVERQVVKRLYSSAGEQR